MAAAGKESEGVRGSVFREIAPRASFPRRFFVMAPVTPAGVLPAFTIANTTPASKVQVVRAAAEGASAAGWSTLGCGDQVFMQRDDGAGDWFLAITVVAPEKKKKRQTSAHHFLARHNGVTIADASPQFSKCMGTWVGGSHEWGSQIRATCAGADTDTESEGEGEDVPAVPAEWAAWVAYNESLPAEVRSSRHKINMFEAPELAGLGLTRSQKAKVLGKI